MRILHIASELTSVAKVGGLGDVLMGLSRELVVRGDEVLVLLPSYGCTERKHLSTTGRVDTFSTMIDGKRCTAKLSHYLLDSVIPVALLDTDEEFFSRRCIIYGDSDDSLYFLAFSRAVCDWISQGTFHPDVIHTHEWPTAIIPHLFRTLFHDKKLGTTVFTVHNFEYQGCCSYDCFLRAGLSPQDFSTVVDDGGHANLLKGGIRCSDVVTTVSPTYANEVLSTHHDLSLRQLLHEKGDRFLGILNGLDYAFWNPETDPLIEHTYGPHDGEARIVAKLGNRRDLFSKLGLPCHEEKPLIAFVTRLVYQKGIDLMAAVLQRASDIGVQAILMGSVPDEETRHRFEEIDRELRMHESGAIFFKNDEILAHHVYAAADYIIVPSLYEPCGLTQLIGLRYGTIPIVRSTGGLADTVWDVETDSTGRGNGFTFSEPNPHDAEEAVRRALRYGENRDRRMALQQHAMLQDHSWKRPEQAYRRIYTFP